MAKTMFPTDPISAGPRCVEPARRMVGGRFGWARHRFPIKGGITARQAAVADLAMALSAEVNRTSYFTRLLVAAE